MEIGKKYFINRILCRALFDNQNLPQNLKKSVTELIKFGKNPAKVIKSEVTAAGYLLTLEVAECYDSNSVPAVMCEAYNSYVGNRHYFDNVDQADLLFTENSQVSLTNISNISIQASQLVRLVYNNKNLLIIPVESVQNLVDYHGVIGKSQSVIPPLQSGIIKLFEVAQVMDNENFLKLNIHGRRGI